MHVGPNHFRPEPSAGPVADAYFFLSLSLVLYIYIYLYDRKHSVLGSASAGGFVHIKPAHLNHLSLVFGIVDARFLLLPHTGFLGRFKPFLEKAVPSAALFALNTILLTW